MPERDSQYEGLWQICNCHSLAAFCFLLKSDLIRQVAVVALQVDYKK